MVLGRFRQNLLTKNPPEWHGRSEVRLRGNTTTSGSMRLLEAGVGMRMCATGKKWRGRTKQQCRLKYARSGQDQEKPGCCFDRRLTKENCHRPFLIFPLLPWCVCDCKRQCNFLCSSQLIGREGNSEAYVPKIVKGWLVLQLSVGELMSFRIAATK